MDKITNVEKAEKSFTENDFLRETLIRLYKSTAPQDVFDGEFSKVQAKEVEFLCVTCKDVKVNYTCAVGFDKEEIYWDSEIYYDANNQKRTRPVEKTRINTDWRPFNGTTEEEETVCFVKNAETSVDSYEEEETFYASYKACYDAGKTADCDGVEIAASDAVFERAKQLCCRHCVNRVNLPGDHVKNIDWTGNATVDSAFGILITEYSLEFKYDDKVYHAKSYASGKPNISIEIPSNEKQVKEGNKKIKRKLLPLTITIVLLCIAAILCGGLIPVFTHDFSFPWYVVLGLPAIAVLVIYFIIRGKLIRKTEKKWQARKFKDLNFLLKKFRLEEYYE